MLLSVIIVHYRVPYFLELCLLSVESALQGLEAEILVIDNHSADLSPEFLRPRFTRVRWIFNAENRGFARANNQGLALARGEYILFLNPDTVVPEDFARNCLDFYRGGLAAFAKASAAEAGGLGIRMIDGSGRFLKESRRGFPSPWVAFCRLSGLTTLFPRSRWFSQYYLGHLPADRAQPAPILSGACLWVSREALNATGPFDEDFFMYAEDIDLSYRLEQAGFCNYYLAGTTIIHFKGASTQKDMRYTRQFYRAMSQFRSKHFQRGMPGLFRAGLELAIWARATVAAAGRIFGGRSGSRRGKELRTWITGDPVSVEALRRRLGSERTLVAEGAQATEIIICQGPGFSFKELISAVEHMGRGKTVGLYAAGAGAVVASRHHDNRGDILKL